MPIIPSGGDPVEQLRVLLADIVRRVRNLESARPLESAAITRGGIQVTGGGTLTVVDTDGRTVAVLGALPTQYNRADGSRQPGLVFYREDGSTAVFLGDANPTVSPFQQALQITDRAGRAVLADDTNSGHGLANPHITGCTLQDTNTATWPATTAATWTTIAYGYYEVQNPLLSWSFGLQADTGTTGQFRLLVNSSQVGTTQTVTAGFATWSPLPVSLVAAGNAIGSIPLIELQAQRTAGTGTVRGVCLYMSGAQS